MSRRDWTLRLMLVGALGWSLLLPHAAAARPSQGIGGFGCSVSSGDVWFVEQLDFDAVTLAPGVLVAPADPHTSDDFVQLSNTSAISLYLVELESSNRNLFVPAAPIALANNAFVRSQIVSDTVSVWAENPTEHTYAWRKQAGNHTIRLSRSWFSTNLLGYKDRQMSGDHRPPSLAVPRPQVLALQVIYGTELISIPVTQTHTINAAYNPTRAQDEQAACGSWGDKLVDQLIRYVYLGVIGLIVVTVLVILLVSWILKRSSR